MARQPWPSLLLSRWPSHLPAQCRLSLASFALHRCVIPPWLKCHLTKDVFSLSLSQMPFLSSLWIVSANTTFWLTLYPRIIDPEVYSKSYSPLHPQHACGETRCPTSVFLI